MPFVTSRPDDAPGFDLTVVVPTKGRPELCGEALAAAEVVQSRTGLRFDVVVVEQGERPAYPIPDGFRGRWVFTDRSGASMARNIGLDMALAPHVMFVDDDAVMQPTVAELVADLHRSGGDLVVGAMVSPGGRSVRGGDRRAVLRPWNAFRLFVEPTAVWSVAALRAVGGFDERLGQGNPLGCEEGIEAVARLVRRTRGAPDVVRFVPEVAVVHPDLRSAPPVKSRMYGAGTSGLVIVAPSWWAVGYSVVSLVRRCAGALVALLRRDRPGFAHRAGWIAGWFEGPFIARRERRRPRRGATPSLVVRVDTGR